MAVADADVLCRDLPVRDRGADFLDRPRLAPMQDAVVPALRERVVGVVEVPPALPLHIVHEEARGFLGPQGLGVEVGQAGVDVAFALRESQTVLPWPAEVLGDECLQGPVIAEFEGVLRQDEFLHDAPPHHPRRQHGVPRITGEVRRGLRVVAHPIALHHELAADLGSVLMQVPAGRAGVADLWSKDFEVLLAVLVEGTGDLGPLHAFGPTLRVLLRGVRRLKVFEPQGLAHAAAQARHVVEVLRPLEELHVHRVTRGLRGREDDDAAIPAGSDAF